MASRVAANKALLVSKAQWVTKGRLVTLVRRVTKGRQVSQALWAIRVHQETKVP